MSFSDVYNTEQGFDINIKALISAFCLELSSTKDIRIKILHIMKGWSTISRNK